MTPTRKSLSIVAAIVVIFGTQQLAQADPLILSLNPPSQAGVAGGTVTFLASTFNSGATNTNTDTITGGSINAPGIFAGNIDVSPFAVNWNGQQVVSGATRGPLAIFIVTIPVGTPDGSYSGNITLSGLSDAPAGPLGGNPFVTNFVTSTGEGGKRRVEGPLGVVGTFVTNTVQWTVRVESGPAPVPEPATMLLLGSGLVGIAAKVRKRRKSR